MWLQTGGARNTSGVRPDAGDTWRCAPAGGPNANVRIESP